jgi:hypothetical protein
VQRQRVEGCHLLLAAKKIGPEGEIVPEELLVAESDDLAVLGVCASWNPLRKTQDGYYSPPV